MNIEALARPDIVAMRPYSSARSEAPAEGCLLNANEAPQSLAGGPTLQLNRYPDPQPRELVEALAALYGVPADHLLVTRGSDEGIDLLTRVFCRSGVDAIAECPPCFGMYRIAAQIQGAAVVAVKRDPEHLALNVAELEAALSGDDRIRLVHLTSPNNPTGDLLPPETLQRVLGATNGRALTVVDEAYAEFCPGQSFVPQLQQQPGLVILRTLSKAWASAGLRCGVVLAHPDVINLLKRVIAPYPLPQPVVHWALETLRSGQSGAADALRTTVMENKQQLLALLERHGWIIRIWPGAANFVLIRVADAAGLVAHCRRNGVLLRGFSEPLLADCVRITVGSKEELDALQRALNEWNPEDA